MSKHTPAEEPKAKKKKEKRPMTTSRKLFLGVLILLGAIVLAVAGRYVHVMFVNPMSAFDAPAAAPTPSPVVQNVSVPEITPVPTPTLSPEEALQQQADTEFMRNKVNILMLGWDQSPEREDASSSLYRDESNNYRSDVIMLLTIDFETNRVDLISVPRDTYAPIYNTTGRWKINAAFAHGGSAEGEGFQYAMNTVGSLLGVPIQYYAGVDMTGLKAVVDAMGGVEYDVDVRIVLNGRVLEKGYQHLDGQQVLDYCRARKGISTDVGRADRQQRMLFAIFEQMKSRNQLVNIPKIYASVQDMLHTNLNTEQIAALAVFAMKLDMEDLHRHTLSGQYISGVYGGASFYVLNNARLKTLVKEVFGTDVQADDRYDINFVEADKAASAGMQYLDGATHLQEIFGSFAPGMDILLACAEELRSVADRTVAVTGDDPDAVALDKTAIESAQHKMHSAMLNACRLNNITKEQVEKSRMPAEIYSELPSSHIPINPGQIDVPEVGGDADAGTDTEAIEDANEQLTPTPTLNNRGL